MTDLQKTRAVLHAVLNERRAQDAKWGEQNHPNGTGDQSWLLHGATLAQVYEGGPVTMGTLAYVARNTTDEAAANRRLTYADVLLEEVGEAFAEDDPQALRAELIQVAAVAVAWVEKIDREADR